MAYMEHDNFQNQLTLTFLMRYSFQSISELNIYLASIKLFTSFMNVNVDTG